MQVPQQNMSLETPISDLEIESLDLAVIVFNIEDTLDIEIPYNSNEEVEDFATVGSIANKVEELIAKSRVAA
jgi:acyl carrier protein